MNKCEDCQKEKRCAERRGSHKYCFTPKKQTNYDRIRDMSVEEMAEFFSETASRCNTCGADLVGKCAFEEVNGCDPSDLKKWLESEVQDNETL